MFDHDETPPHFVCELCGDSWLDEGVNRFDQSNICTQCDDWEKQEASRKYDQDQNERRK